ncbi:MAG: hypothetical protein AAB316_19140 [Bacteroidota bacterium]
MFEKIKSTVQHAGDSLKGQAVAIGEAAKEKGFQIIETWVSILPKLEKYGMKANYFSVGVSINPVLEVELRAKPADFPEERVQQLLEENKDNTPLRLVFSAIKTTYQLHNKAHIHRSEPLTVKIKVRLSPEVKVSFGRPILD